MIEPRIGETFSLHGIKVKTYSKRDDEDCNNCAFAHLKCNGINCCSISREDLTRVIFKEVEQTKIKSMEVKIQIPDNCELIKNGDTYIVKEKKQGPSRSWEEFCERYPVKKGEAYIDPNSIIDVANYGCSRNVSESKNWCTSKEEAEAFLALMQLRQLRKAWVGNEKEFEKPFCIICRHDMFNKPISVVRWNTSHRLLSFPSEQMAKDFLNCFKDLCETAKILL